MCMSCSPSHQNKLFIRYLFVTGKQMTSLENGGQKKGIFKVLFWKFYLKKEL